MNISATMVCTKCGRVYDVLYQGENVWTVYNPAPQLVIEMDGNVRPLDFYAADQTQCAVMPICINPLCAGWLTDEDISVPSWPGAPNQEEAR